MAPKANILIVDDESRMCDSLKTLLQTDAYDIQTAVSGHDALALLNQKMFDLVLMDYVLPDLEGPRLMEQINLRQPDARLVVMTGQATLDKAVEALRKGACDFITKPFAFDALRSSVRVALDSAEKAARLVPARKDGAAPPFLRDGSDDGLPDSRAASGFSDSVLIGDIVQQAFSVAPETLVADVKTIFNREDPVNAVVVAVNRKPVGLVMSIHLDRILSQRYGFALYSHKPIGSIMEKNPLVLEKTAPIERVSHLAMSRKRGHLFDHIVVTQNGLVAGTVSIRRLLIMLNNLQESRAAQLQRTNANLKKALEQIKTLRGLLPICSNCKKIRDDRGYWRQIESYIASHSEAEFSHSICPECAAALYPDLDLGPQRQ